MSWGFDRYESLLRDLKLEDVLRVAAADAEVEAEEAAAQEHVATLTTFKCETP